MPKGALKFKSMTVGKQQGELARFRVLGGPDSGVVYVITNARSTIGRAEDNDVILSDIKASRKHAELSVVGGTATLRDMGSSHGFVVNGVQQKQAQLRSGDKVGLGGTVLEFIGSQESGATQMIVRPPVQSSKVVGTLNSQSGLTQFIQRPTSGGAAPGAANQKPQGFLEKNKKLVIMMALLMAAGGGVQEVQKRSVKVKPYAPPVDPGATETGVLAKEDTSAPQFKQADVYFLIGKRELRAENWLRARDNFDTALQIYPNHKLAKVYRETTIHSEQAKAKELLKAAASEEIANRIRVAINNCDAVRRMFEFDQASAVVIEEKGRKRDLYKEAVDKITDLKKKLEEMGAN